MIEQSIIKTLQHVKQPVYPSPDFRHAWPKISITSMRKFADFTLYTLKCRVGPSFIYLVFSAMFIWTYSFVSNSSNSIFFLAWSACLTLKREFLSCQLQFSLRTSKGRRPNIGSHRCRCRSIRSRYFPIPLQSVPILSVPIETESATGQTSSSGQLQTSPILDLYLSAFIKGL